VKETAPRHKKDKSSVDTHPASGRTNSGRAVMAGCTRVHATRGSLSLCWSASDWSIASAVWWSNSWPLHQYDGEDRRRSSRGRLGSVPRRKELSRGIPVGISFSMMRLGLRPCGNRAPPVLQGAHTTAYLRLRTMSLRCTNTACAHLGGEAGFPSRSRDKRNASCS
jgi:hypothetical protein